MKAELLDQNQLQLVVKQSGLEEVDANILLTKFQDYFKIAAEWEVKAKSIIVNDASQKAEMQMARAGRLYLREKRIDIENARKELKESSLRRGKAIDGCANILKDLIVPIEQYLEKQEKFVEFEEAKKQELIRIEIEKKMEEERIAKEKLDAEEKEKLRIENELLRKQAEEQESKVKKERQEAERKAKEEQDKIQREANKKIAEAKAIADKAQAELKAKQDEETSLRQEEEIKAEEAKKASDNIKLLKLQEELANIKFPEVKSKRSKDVIEKVKSLLLQADDIIKKGKQS